MFSWLYVFQCGALGIYNSGTTLTNSTLVPAICTCTYTGAYEPPEGRQTLWAAHALLTYIIKHNLT